MNTPEKTETASPRPSKEPQPAKTRHGLLLAAVITTVVLAVLVMIVQHVPELVARYVIQRELERMGIANEGVGSLHIDLWRSQVFLGHMRFGGGPENQGQVGRVSVKYRLVNLLSEQAVIEEMIIDGIDVHVVRETDGKIEINGINLDQFVAAEQEAEPVAEDESSWGAGLDKFELRNSRVFFTDRSRGTLTLEVERLDLEGFRTFEPDKPGTFELVAKLNEIPLHWSGETRPFADILTVAIDTEINEVDFAKIERYTGPLGLERRSGVLNAEFTHNITVHPNGRIEVGSDGNIEIRDGDTLYPDLFAINYDNGNMGLATSFVLDDSGNVGLTGSVTLDLENWSIDAKGTKLGASAANIESPDFSLIRRADSSLEFAAKPRLTIEQPKVSGTANGKGAQFTLDLSELKVEQAGEAISVTLAGATTLDALDLALAEPKEEGGSGIGEPVRIGFANARLDLAKMLLASKEGSLRLDAQPKLSVAGPSLSGPVQISTKELKVDLANLKVEQTGTDLSMTAAGAIALGAVTSAKPVEARSDGLKVDLSSLKVEQAGNDLSVAATGKTVLGASNLSLPNEPSAGEPLQFDFTTAELDLTRMLLALKEGGLRLDAEPRLSVENLELRGPALVTAERLNVALRSLDLTTSGEDSEVKISGQADVSTLQASVPATDGQPAMRVSAERFDTNIGELMAATSGPEQRWQAQLDATITALAADLAEGDIGQVKWKALSLSGGRADQALNVGADTLEIGGLEIEFNEKLFSAFGKGEADEGADKETEKAQSPDKTPAVRLEKFVLSENAKIRYRDTSVTPKVTVDVNVEKLEVSKLDTSDPSQKTDLQLAATVNEFTKVQLSGWTQAFAPEPSFDLKGQVKNVQLASYSPYAAQAIGLNLESGVLDADADGKANEGKLDGNVKLDILDLDFSALSEADAERLSSKVGAPIETVVGLLEDSDGRIKLKLPVSGTVVEPDIDVSQAIGQAIAGALKSIFPPTAIASMLSSGFKGAGINFKDIPFAVGDATLSPQGEEIAANIAQMLKKRPKLRLRVCGRATAADFDAYMADALGPKAAAEPAPTAAKPSASPQAGTPAEPPPASDQQLLEKARSELTNLATDRGRAVRRYVVDSQGISADSLGECLPKFDSTDQDPPRAKVKL